MRDDNIDLSSRSPGGETVAKRRDSGRSFILLIVTLALSVTSCAVAFLLLTHVWQMRSAGTLVGHTHLVIEGLAEVLATADDAATSQRDFLLTDESGFLQPYYADRDNLPHQLSRIQDLIQDNAVQQANLRVLRDVLDDRFAGLTRSIELEQAGEKAAALDAARLDRGKARMDDLRKATSTMVAEEQRLLRGRQTELSRTQQQVVTLAICVLILLILGILLAVGAASAVFTRKRSEAAVRQSEARLRQFIDSAPVAIAMFDTGMRYLAVSRRFIIDYHITDQATLIGRSHYDVFPEVSDDWRRIHARVLHGETMSSDAEAFVHADGSVNWIRWEMVPWTVDGTIHGAMWFTEDVTDHKADQAALLAGEARLRLVQQISGIAYTDWTYPDTSALISPEFAQIYGLASGQTGVDLGEFIARIHPDDR
ncbi:MAG TPA: CHASE3 domain-containing protein, partial [Rhodopila sp.]